MPAGDNDLGQEMSGKWFSNRGQMVQVACTVLAVIIGVVTQWNQITSTIDIGPIFKILLYPSAAVGLFQLGSYFSGRKTSVHANPGLIAQPKPDFDYQFLHPTIKIGSYIDLARDFGLRRVAVSSIQTRTIGSEEVPVAEIEVAGIALYLSGGNSVIKINDKKFLIPAYSRDLKSEGSSIHEFGYSTDYFTLTAISVDHINIAAQEVSLAICLVKYRPTN
jgi:hypothetical protein